MNYPIEKQKLVMDQETLLTLAAHHAACWDANCQPDEVTAENVRLWRIAIKAIAFSEKEREGSDV